MYVPTQFEEKDVALLHAAMRAAGLGTLVTLGSEGLEASHVPMLLDPDPAPYGRLLGHVSRGNPQWTRVAAASEGLAIFLGPGAYVSPSLYPSKRETGRVVPTWNYVAVHAYGTVEFFEDRDRLRDVVTRLTGKFESGRTAPWAVDDAPAEFIAGQLNGIIGFALPIARLEGKWKMSQNRPPQDRAGVAAGLAAEAPAVAAAVAERDRG